MNAPEPVVTERSTSRLFERINEAELLFCLAPVSDHPRIRAMQWVGLGCGASVAGFILWNDLWNNLSGRDFGWMTWVGFSTLAVAVRHVVLALRSTRPQENPGDASV